MSERKYTLMVGDVLTITFPRPGEVAQLKQLNAGLNRQLSDYLHPELDR